MLKKMNEKKNNKGFSLVELIVVILIMAVLAVALAPQVMKWVGNSRIAADVQTQNDIASIAQLTLADSTAYEAAKDNKYTMTVSTGADTKLTIAIDGVSPFAADAFTKAFMKAVGETTDTSATTTKIKAKGSTQFTVIVDKGVVSKGGELDSAAAGIK